MRGSHTPEEAQRMSNHRRILSNLDTDLPTSSDDSHDEEVEDIETESTETTGGQSIIGVSIGTPQDRLRAPQTPAAEKEEALAGQDPFDAALRDCIHDGDDDDDARVTYMDGSVDATQPTSFNTHKSTVGKRSHEAQSRHAYTERLSAAALKQGSGPSRATTGPPPIIQNKKLVSFNLPSLPSLPSFGKAGNRFSLPSIDGALNWVRGAGNEDVKGEQSASSGYHSRAMPQRRSSFDNMRDPPTSPALGHSGTSKAPSLRRSTSDGSLTLKRSTSSASSLGDDSRFEHIQSMVNSRSKAIKDSWADTNIRMPRFRSPAWLDSYKANGNSVMLRGQARSMGPTQDASASDSNFSSMQQPPVSPPGGMSKTAVVQHPEFTRALKRLTGDVVILGGYRGSVLRSAEPPNRQVWIPVKVGLNIRKVNLEVGLDSEDETRMSETIIPSGALKNIGPVDISRRLFKRLGASRNADNGSLRIWDYGYDWRLSPHLLSRQLEEYLEGLPCNAPGVAPERRGATVIAHSLGGLITRHVINRRPELVSGVVYAGAPFGCVNILGPLRNGDEVLLSSKVLTAQVNFSIRTSFALLPLDGKCFIDEDTKEHYDIDFFDPQNWEDYRLSPCIARPLPPLPKDDEPQGLVSSLVGSMASVLPSVNVRRNSSTKRQSRHGSPHGASSTGHTSVGSVRQNEKGPENPMAAHMNAVPNPQKYGGSEEHTISTAVTIPKDRAWQYLTRTLAEVKAFKQELAYNPELESRYPPATVIYGKSVPTVCGAKVRGREGIKRADAFDRLQFASGDGVVLARAAQLPEGYRPAPGGVVSSDRGHIGLLGDLEAVGRCLNAVTREQRRRYNIAKSGEPMNASVAGYR